MYEAALGKSKSDLKWDDIQLLVADARSEDPLLEFKRELPPPDDKSRREAARDITSFANATGGVILYGVEDTDDKASGIHEVDLGEGFDSLLKSMRGYISPPVPGLDYKFISGPTPSMGVIALSIPSSALSPHAVNEPNSISYWRRSGTNKQLLYEADIERLYRARWNRTQDAIGRLRDSTNRAVGQLVHGGFVFVMTPSHVQSHMYGPPHEGLDLMRRLLARMGTLPDMPLNALGTECRPVFGAIESGEWVAVADSIVPTSQRSQMFDTGSRFPVWCRVERDGTVIWTRDGVRLPTLAIEASKPLGGAPTGMVGGHQWLESCLLTALVLARCIAQIRGDVSSYLVRTGVVANGLAWSINSRTYYALPDNVMNDIELEAASLTDVQRLLGIGLELTLQSYAAFGDASREGQVFKRSDSGMCIQIAQANRTTLFENFAKHHALPIR